MAFRYGIGRTGYLEQIRTNPSLWSYAKKAGYKTFYFDAQRTAGLMQNGMDNRERKEIDALVQVDGAVKPQDKDVELATMLRRTLDAEPGTPKFVYVNKMGAHYPYEGKYPPERGWFAPVLRRDYFGNDADPRGALRRVDEGDIDRVKFKNSYLNAVGWNASRFNEILLQGLDLSKTIVLYMSDHGQDLHEDGRPGFNTHCNSGSLAHPDEGRVPLAIMTTHPEISAELRAAEPANHDRLSWMGYPRAAIAGVGTYDPLIDEPPVPNAQRFLSTFFVRLGEKPAWVDCAPATQTTLLPSSPQ
jgi:glucan phosphoethanolaminetransferase (alkaline phosphatase superfamily)